LLYELYLPAIAALKQRRLSCSKCTASVFLGWNCPC